MKRFALTLLIFTLGLIFSFAAFNLIVDPYNVTRIVNVRGFNANRTQVLSDGARVHIADNLLRGGYRTVFLGNSRVARGLPESAPWPGSTFNAGVASSSAFELGRAAVLAGRSPATQCVVMALELEDFNSVAKVKGAYWISALSDASWLGSLMRQALASGTLRNSYQTVRDNMRDPAPPTPAPEPGFETGEPGEPREHFELMARDSYRTFSAFSYDPERMEYLATIVDRLTARGIQVVLFFSPIHGWREESIFRAGHESDYFRIRREAVTQFSPFADRAARAPCVAGSALQIWDFSGFQGPARVDPPAANAVNSSRYYFESSHFTPVVGQAILQRVAGLETEGGPLAPDVFGIELDMASLPSAQAAVEVRRQSWLQSQSGREAAARFEEWSRENLPLESTRRFFIDRDDWLALDRDLPALRSDDRR